MRLTASSHGLPREPGRTSEDACALRERDETCVAAVADGVGSALEGRAAAELAVRSLTDNYLARPLAWAPSRALREFTAQLNARLHSESLARHGRAEMICTLSAVALERDTLRGLNIGDSPVFVFRRGRLQRLSRAHTVADEAMKHVLTRALGMEPAVEPHEFAWAVEPGDLVLLCSDGVDNILGETRLAELLSRSATARVVVADAAERATPQTADDLSAIVIEVHASAGEAEIQDSTAAPTLEVVEKARAGEVLDGWTLGREMQSGGRVWLATDAAGARAVLKFPPLDARRDDALAAAFVREAWNATRLGGGFFPRAWQPAGPALRWYAMEYIEAPTLREVLRQRPLAVEETIALARFLLGAAEHLLGQDLVHGDIKPENVLVLRRTDAPVEFRLLDLGSAAPIFAAAGRAGTASYLAPERFAGAPLSERTEIFAVGVTLYEALTRTFPYGEIERFQTPRFEGSPKSPARLNAAVPPWLAAVVCRALASDPENRQQAYSEMRFEIEHPEQVQPFHGKNASLLERNPLGFFRVAFFVSLLVNLVLLARCHAR